MCRITEMRSDWMFWLVSFIPASVNMERARVRTAGNQTYETEEKNSCVYAVQSLSLVWLFATPGLQYTSLPLPSLSPRVCSNSCPLSWWCHPTISSSIAPSSSCPQSRPCSQKSPMKEVLWWSHFTDKEPRGPERLTYLLKVNSYYDWLTSEQWLVTIK